MDIKRLSPKQRILGIDYGERFMGFSISDPNWIVATPLYILDRKQKGFETYIHELTQQYGDFAAIVIGLPLSMNGSEGPQAQKVRRFAEKHTSEFHIILWDERTSTKAVNRHSKKAHTDDLAATFTLQGFLDTQNRQ